MPVTETCEANAHISHGDIENLCTNNQKCSDKNRTYCGCSSSSNRRPAVATKQGLKLVLANANSFLRHFGC